MMSYSTADTINKQGNDGDAGSMSSSSLFAIGTVTINGYTYIMRPYLDQNGHKYASGIELDSKENYEKPSTILGVTSGFDSFSWCTNYNIKGHNNKNQALISDATSVSKGSAIVLYKNSVPITVNTADYGSATFVPATVENADGSNYSALIDINDIKHHTKLGANTIHDSSSALQFTIKGQTIKPGKIHYSMDTPTYKDANNMLHSKKYRKQIHKFVVNEMKYSAKELEKTGMVDD